MSNEISKIKIDQLKEVKLQDVSKALVAVDTGKPNELEAINLKGVTSSKLNIVPSTTLMNTTTMTFQVELDGEALSIGELDDIVIEWNTPNVTITKTVLDNVTIQITIDETNDVDETIPFNIRVKYGKLSDTKTITYYNKVEPKRYSLHSSLNTVEVGVDEYTLISLTENTTAIDLDDTEIEVNSKFFDITKVSTFEQNIKVVKLQFEIKPEYAGYDKAEVIHVKYSGSILTVIGTSFNVSKVYESVPVLKFDTYPDVDKKEAYLYFSVNGIITTIDLDALSLKCNESCSYDVDLGVHNGKDCVIVKYDEFSISRTLYATYKYNGKLLNAAMLIPATEIVRAFINISPTTTQFFNGSPITYTIALHVNEVPTSIEYGNYWFANKDGLTASIQLVNAEVNGLTVKVVEVIVTNVTGEHGGTFRVGVNTVVSGNKFVDATVGSLEAPKYELSFPFASVMYHSHGLNTDIPIIAKKNGQSYEELDINNVSVVSPDGAVAHVELLNGLGKFRLVLDTITESGTFLVVWDSPGGEETVEIKIVYIYDTDYDFSLLSPNVRITQDTEVILKSQLLNFEEYVDISSIRFNIAKKTGPNILISPTSSDNPPFNQLVIKADPNETYEEGNNESLFTLSFTYDGIQFQRILSVLLTYVPDSSKMVITQDLFNFETVESEFIPIEDPSSVLGSDGNFSTIITYEKNKIIQPLRASDVNITLPNSTPDTRVSLTEYSENQVKLIITQCPLAKGNIIISHKFHTEVSKATISFMNNILPKGDTYRLDVPGTNIMLQDMRYTKNQYPESSITVITIYKNDKLYEPALSDIVLSLNGTDITAVIEKGIPEVNGQTSGSKLDLQGRYMLKCSNFKQENGSVTVALNGSVQTLNFKVESDNTINAAGRYFARSYTELTIGSNVQVILELADKTDYSTGMAVIIAHDVDNYMEGQVVSRVGELLTVNVNNNIGSGTYDYWEINIAGASGMPGEIGPKGDDGESVYFDIDSDKVGLSPNPGGPFEYTDHLSGENGKSLLYDWNNTQLGIKQEGSSDPFEYSELQGATGPNIELTKAISGGLDWKVAGTSSWHNLYQYDELKGDDLEFLWNGDELGVRVKDSGTDYTYSAPLTGPKGDDGLRFKTTSNSTVIVGTGTKNFEVEAGLGYTADQYVIASSASRVLYTRVISYAGTTLILDCYHFDGVGTSSSWVINISGQQGPAGTDGIDGLDGIDGTDGLDGQNGANSTILGEAPVAVILAKSGAKGDIWIATDSDSGYIKGYGLQSDGEGAGQLHWRSTGRLLGYQGLQGIKGEKGDKGNTGLDGEDGTILKGTSNTAINITAIQLSTPQRGQTINATLNEDTDFAIGQHIIFVADANNSITFTILNINGRTFTLSPIAKLGGATHNYWAVNLTGEVPYNSLSPDTDANIINYNAFNITSSQEFAIEANYVITQIIVVNKGTSGSVNANPPPVGPGVNLRIGSTLNGEEILPTIAIDDIEPPYIDNNRFIPKMGEAWSCFVTIVSGTGDIYIQTVKAM